MKKIFYIILYTLLIYFSTGCRKLNNYIQPGLDSIITEYIKTNPYDSIYQVCFYKFCNKQFFSIRCSGTEYDSRFNDICFEKNNKIIVAYSINASLMDSLINIPLAKQCCDALKKYVDWNDDALRDYDKDDHLQTYRILNANQYRLANESDYFVTDSVHSCNVITNGAINRVLNQYLNNSNMDLTYIRFDSRKGETYLTIGQDYVYSKNAFSGAFYRDGRIIIIYDLDKLENKKIIDRTQLLPVTELKEYREVVRKRAIFPEMKFIINSDGELIRINGVHSN